MSTVRFIHQHEDFFRIVELWKLLESDVFREGDCFVHDFLVPAWLLLLTHDGHRHFVARLLARFREHKKRIALRFAADRLIFLKHGHDDVRRALAQ